MAKNTNKKKNVSNASNSTIRGNAKKRAEQMYASQKKNKATAKASGKPKEKKQSYWKGVKQELSKVVWPSKKELGTYTLVVIITCAIFAVGFWAIDTGVMAAIKGVIG